MRKSTLAQMRSLAHRRGGECTSKRYINSRIPLQWRCSRGHQWKAMPTNVCKGSWCPTCAHRKRLTIGEMRALARRRGGECMPDQYVNSETKLLWRCAAGHEWKAAPGLVKGGRWCPHCAHVAHLSLETMVQIASSRGGALFVDRVRQCGHAPIVEMPDWSSMDGDSSFHTQRKVVSLLRSQSQTRAQSHAGACARSRREVPLG
jgi:hypothetical protein